MRVSNLYVRANDVERVHYEDVLAFDYDIHRVTWLKFKIEKKQIEIFKSKIEIK